MKTHLVIIDPQNSFCKVVQATEQQSLHDGELCVAGAWDDMTRTAALVKRLGSKLKQVHITLDSHHQWHIAHPCWFKDGKGQPPAPFTMMTEDKGIITGHTITNAGWSPVGEYVPALFGEDYKWTYTYLRELQSSKRFPHIIWPYHCLIGTPGHNIVAPLADAILEWERNTRQTVNKITKGSCRHAEHFSAVRAEIAYPKDPSTQLNAEFIQMLGHEVDEVLIAGEALSHCVAASFRDISNELGDEFVKKCVLLKDASSPVTHFEQQAQDFIDEMTKRGMRTTTTNDYLK